MKDKENIKENLIALWKKSEKDRVLKIKGTSMKPLIVEGSTITCRPILDSGNLKIGDIAVFGRSGIVVHRIVDRIRKDGKTWFKEKGDNSFFPTLITSDAIIGKVIGVNKNDMNIDLTRYRWFFLNRFIGYYWKTLFTGLEVMITVKNKIAGQMKFHFVGPTFRKISRLLIKLPTKLFRSNS